MPMLLFSKLTKLENADCIHIDRELLSTDV